MNLIVLHEDRVDCTFFAIKGYFEISVFENKLSTAVQLSGAPYKPSILGQKCLEHAVKTAAHNSAWDKKGQVIHII